MKRFAACLLVAIVLQGCARGRSGRESADAQAEADLYATARPAAAALVFEPAMAADSPRPDLSREGRQPEAFFGYTDGVTEYFYVRWDDRQANWGHGRHGGSNYDRFERRAVSEKVGAVYR